MFEFFKPIAIRPPSDNKLFFFLRCVLDLQAFTVFRFLKKTLTICSGCVLDVGAGQSPWKELIPSGVKYVGIDTYSANKFGMKQRPDITYYDSGHIPYEDGYFDYVLCTEVLEHVADPLSFLFELRRVLRKDGTLILTVPWSARLHHLPYDYGRFTSFGLVYLLKKAGFNVIVNEERGNDLAVIANKLLVVLIRLLRPKRRVLIMCTGFLAAILIPLVVIFFFIAHISIFFQLGSKLDPLGYGVVAVKVD